jgi:hypothetical protein
MKLKYEVEHTNEHPARAIVEKDFRTYRRLSLDDGPLWQEKLLTHDEFSSVFGARADALEIEFRNLS